VTSTTVPTCPRCGSVLLDTDTHTCSTQVQPYGPVREGWRCPGCHRCYSPIVLGCGYCEPPVVPSSGTSPSHAEAPAVEDQKPLSDDELLDWAFGRKADQPEPSEPTDTQRLDWYERLAGEKWELNDWRFLVGVPRVSVCFFQTDKAGRVKRETPRGLDLRTAIDAAARHLGWIK